MASKAELVSLPESFVHELDKLVDNGDYSSRADFILSAIREYHSTIILGIARFYKEYDKLMETKNRIAPAHSAAAFLKFIVLSYLGEFTLQDYSHEKINVMVRLPPRLFEDILYLVNEKFFDSRQDFYRRAIEHYVDSSEARKNTINAYRERDAESLKNILVNRSDYLGWTDYLDSGRYDWTVDVKDMEGDHSLDHPKHNMKSKDASE